MGPELSQYGRVQEVEEMLAAAIEATLAEESRSLGPRTRRDAVDGSGILVDFTYDDAEPPVALEITTVQDDHFRSTVYEARKLRNRLNEAAKNEGLTPFRFTIDERAEVRTLYDPLIELMRSGVSIRPGIYSSDDLREWEDVGALDERLEQHRQLTALWITDAEAAPTDREVTISTCGESTGGWSPATGLEDVELANITKLLELGPSYEKHLAIGVGQYRVSQFADLTPVPAIPEGLDRLWLAHLWQASESMLLWSVVPGDRAWRVHAAVPQRP